MTMAAGARPGRRNAFRRYCTISQTASPCRRTRSRSRANEEIADYYRLHAAEFTAPAGLRPFAEVREQIRSQLGAAQRATLVAAWLDGLRRRTEIADLYVVEQK